jgi:hypothetical protein
MRFLSVLLVGVAACLSLPTHEVRAADWRVPSAERRAAVQAAPAYDQQCFTGWWRVWHGDEPTSHWGMRCWTYTARGPAFSRMNKDVAEGYECCHHDMILPAYGYHPN